MQRASPIGQAVFRLHVRPSRAAYLVRAGDWNGPARAIQEATTRWGGFAEPIVPVRTSGRIDPWWRQVIELSDVEGLVNVGVGAAVASQVASRLGLPIVDISRIDDEGETSFSTHPVNLGEVSEALAAPAILPTKRSRLWEKVAVGDLSTSREAEWAEVWPLLRARDTSTLLSAQINRTSCLDVSARFFGEYTAQGYVMPSPSIVWVVNPSSLLDCLLYWNMRALRAITFNDAVMLVIPASRDIDLQNVGYLLSRSLARPESIEPDVVVASHCVAMGRLEAMALDLGFVSSTGPSKSSISIPKPAPRAAPSPFPPAFPPAFPPSRPRPNLLPVPNTRPASPSTSRCTV